jgi:putative membrane protein
MLRTLLLLPFLVVLVAFALSNPQPVQLRIWPLDFLSLEVPLSLAMLVGCAVFFFLGALFVWFGSVAARGRAARAERRAAALEAELKARNTSAVMPLRPTSRANVPALAAPK